MSNYDEDYKRRTAKVRKAEPYSPDQIGKIVSLLNSYFIIVPLKGKLKNPANYNDLASRVNDYYRDVIVIDKNAKDIINGRYICEIYTGTDKSKSKKIIRIETLEKFLNEFIKTRDSISTTKDDVQLLEIVDWKGSVDHAAPQWADHFEISLSNRLIKGFSCEVHTNSPYYRFGAKLFSIDGKLFGDASIQSQTGLNILVHVAKNFESEQLFVASYRNGVRLYKNKDLDVFSNGEPYTYELNIDSSGFLFFYINGQEIYKILTRQEVRQRVCLYVWGDGFDPDPALTIKNIQIETTES